MTRDAYVYQMANNHNAVLYIGVTNDLLRRVAEHKLGLQRGFTQHRCTKLVYFEAGDSIVAAIEREKQLKTWRRSWKDDLVASMNPTWQGLAPDIGLTTAVLASVGRSRRSPGWAHQMKMT